MRLQRQFRTMWKQTRKNQPAEVVAVLDRLIADLIARRRVRGRPHRHAGA